MLLTSTILSSLAPGSPVRQMEGGIETGVLVSPDRKQKTENREQSSWSPGIRQAYAQSQTEAEETGRISQRVKELELTGEETDFPATEAPRFTIREHPNFWTRSLTFFKRILGKREAPLAERLQVSLVHATAGTVDGAEVRENGNGEISVDVAEGQRLLPGQSTLTVRDGSRTIEQDFTWGVLAINTNKSIYKPGETAKLAMAVLDEEGEMVCDARVELRIMNHELGIEEVLSTQNGRITVNPSCDNHLYTLTPDYEAEYQVGEAGTYAMLLEATTEQGTFSIRDAFEVRESVAFDIERTSGTRIFPPATYPMTISIKANEDFQGQVIETVPGSFEVMNQELRIMNQGEEFSIIPDSLFMIQETEDGDKSLVWRNVSLRQGDELRLSYSFKAPGESPAFYLLGPLRLFAIGNTTSAASTSTFVEGRAWQLAIDALGVGNTSSATAWSSDTTGVSWSHTIGSGVNQLLVVAIGIKEPTDNDRDVTSVTFDGTQMAEATGAMADDSTANATKR